MRSGGVYKTGSSPIFKIGIGLARSQARELRRRDDSWTDGRRHRTPKGYALLLAELRQETAELPSYGYRRACALVNRQRGAKSDVQVNANRVYRVMAQAGLLLPSYYHQPEAAITSQLR